MSNWCKPEDLALVACTPEVDTVAQIAADKEPDLVAQALQEAAIEILGLDCHKDGSTTWGEPSVDADCCCGQIVTGIITPETFGDSPCFILPAYRWKVMVTWDKDISSVSQVSEESRRLTRRIIETACCKIKDKGQRIGLELVSASNSPDDGRTECPYLTLTVKA